MYDNVVRSYTDDLLKDWPEMNLYLKGDEPKKFSSKSTPKLDRMSTYYKYSDLTAELFPIKTRDILELNGWLRSADILYDGPNKDQVISSFKSFEITTPQMLKGGTVKSQKGMKLATVCEVRKANDLSQGILGNILRKFWSRNEHTMFWNYTELAIYELEDGWWDCRNQSGGAEQEASQQIKSLVSLVQGP